MKYEDIFLKAFSTETVYLEEGIAFTPFLAFSIFRDKIFNKAKKTGNKIDDTIDTAARDVKAKGKLFKEKARAELGVSSKGTVYKLTKEQKEIIKEMYAKYGKELIKDISDFRTNILAPYSLIKRQVRDNQSVSSKDITGLTKEQFKSSLESGRRKIEARGEIYKEKSRELQRRMLKYNDQISSYKKAKIGINSGKVDNNILSKLYKELELSDNDLKGYSPEELRRITSELKKNTRNLQRYDIKKDKADDDHDNFVDTLNKQKELRKGRGVDLTKNREFKRHGSFDIAIGKYFLRNDIRKGLINDRNNPFIPTYISILDNLIDKTEKRKKEKLDSLVSIKKTTEFNEKEKKIWEKRPTVKHDSNKISDYYQKIKEEDFLDKKISIEKPEKVVDAEKEIKNLIKKFERDLSKKIDPADLEKLKKYRLINNLISIKELESPDKLFKTEKEISKTITSNYVSSADFIRKIKEMASREYDSISELNKAKKEVDILVKNMEENDEKEAVEKVSDIIKRFKIRRELNKQDILGHKTDVKELVDIKTIEDFLQKMIKQDYSDFDDYKQDKELLDKMIKKYKAEDEDSEEELDDIQYLFDRLENKMKRGV